MTDAPLRPERHRISTPLEDRMWTYIEHLEAHALEIEGMLGELLEATDYWPHTWAPSQYTANIRMKVKAIINVRR